MNCSSLIHTLLIVFFIMCFSCKTSGPGIFGKKSPHQLYGDRLASAGLRSTMLGTSWFRMADSSVTSPLTINLPYRETGYFAADRPSAAGYRFTALRGQDLTIKVERKPTLGFTIYLDLWKQPGPGNQPKYISSADTITYAIQHEVEDNSTFILRIQPELLSSGEYTITITTGPSLAYPINAPGKNHIKSFWGAQRDGGERKHEGIDLFAPFRTPVVASVSGTVTRVDETPIGGKVIWLHPYRKDYTLYYAHLDSQIVKEGASVSTGDTLGLMGNTGNARTTSPHLHFGIYTVAGPIDPLPFVNPDTMLPEKIHSSLDLLGKMARNKTVSSIQRTNIPGSSDKISIPPYTVFRIEGTTGSWYRVSLPNGRHGYIQYQGIDAAKVPLRKLQIKTSVAVFEKPDHAGPKKASIPPGNTVDILANFDNYYFINTSEKITGWIEK